MTASVYLGTDFGGTKIRVGAVDAEGRLLSSAEVPTEAARGVDAVLANLDRALREACEKADVGIDAVAGIGVAAPGQVDGTTHAIIHGPNIGWVDVPFGAMLRERYPRAAIAVDNDVNAAALGEFRYGAGKMFPAARDLVLIFIGTGVGGGIVANGQVVSGATGAGAEFGHMTYMPGGDPCSCGQPGHFEAYAGGACATRRYAALGGAAQPEHLGGVFELAERGDGAARRVTEDYERAVAVLAANVATVLNPAVLVIGGGVARKRRSLVDVARTGVEKLAMVGSARACRVVESVLWNDAAVLGSAELARISGRRGAS